MPLHEPNTKKARRDEKLLTDSPLVRYAMGFRALGRHKTSITKRAQKTLAAILASSLVQSKP